MQKNIIIGIIILIIGLGAFWYWAQVNDITPAPVLESENEENLYSNTAYGYSFTYPSQWNVNEYLPEAVAIGIPADGGFDALAEVDIVKSEEGSSYGSYEDFVFERASALCAADGPNETLNCTKIERKEAFTSESGLSGEKMYLELAQTNFRDTTTVTSSYGPVYVFNVGANVPEADFATMLIYPPLAHYLINKNTEIVEAVADSISIDRIERAQ